MALILATTADGKAAVVPGSTFDIAVVGSNANGSEFLTQPVAATFGSTQQFVGDALGGQVLTVTSSESMNNGLTTDSFMITVPTNIDPISTTLDGLPITTFEIDVGGYNAGSTAVTFAQPINPASLELSADVIWFEPPLFAGPLPVESTLSDSNSSFAAAATYSDKGDDLAPSYLNGLSIAATYSVSVPEPISITTLLTFGTLSLLHRRRVRVHCALLSLT